MNISKIGEEFEEAETEDCIANLVDFILVLTVGGRYGGPVELCLLQTCGLIKPSIAFMTQHQLKGPKVYDKVRVAARSTGN